MELQRIIEDSNLSTEAKVILLTGEIERLLRSSREDIEITLICEDVAFHHYHAPFVPRVDEVVSCRLTVGKGHFATLWYVKQVVHEVGADRLGAVSVEVGPADTETAMQWQRYPRERP